MFATLFFYLQHNGTDYGFGLSVSVVVENT
jgi:hypothetical protein